MPRIRTVKPEFFRHEALQDLESGNSGLYCMLVFIGLWTQCDCQGIFEYKPRQLKLDILPFLKFDLQKTLNILEKASFLFSYSINGKRYGIIPSLPDHQRFSGKEAGESGKKYPLPINNYSEAMVQQQGSNGEALENDQNFPNAQERERSIGKEYKEKEMNISPERLKIFPEVFVFELPLSDKSYFGVTQSAIDKWQEVFPSVNILPELKRMALWCEDNPTKKKTRKGISRFISTWLDRKQNKGGNGNIYSKPNKEDVLKRLIEECGE